MAFRSFLCVQANRRHPVNFLTPDTAFVRQLREHNGPIEIQVRIVHFNEYLSAPNGK